MAIVKKSKRFAPVKKIAENKEVAAAVDMNKSADVQQAGIQQLKQLQAYREDYVVQFKARGELGLSALMLQEYQTFVQKLDRAIVEQTSVVQRAGKQLDGHKQVFKESHSRRQVVDKLIQKSKKEEAFAADKQEQKVADDRVNKRRGLEE